MTTMLYPLDALCAICGGTWGQHGTDHRCPGQLASGHKSKFLLQNSPKPKPEYTGKSVSYYRVRIDKPTSPELPAYDAECNDIIEALGMNFAEGNAFKALWRRAAARTLGKVKEGYKDGLYDAEKVVFFGERLVAQEKGQTR
ncbi:MAG: hypothetical protein ACKO0Z_05085 [Betaproteobacteria bacterium]